MLKFKGDWIFVRADWPDYYNEHGVTDVSCFQRQPPEESYMFVADADLRVLSARVREGHRHAGVGSGAERNRGAKHETSETIVGRIEGFA